MHPTRLEGGEMCIPLDRKSREMCIPLCRRVRRGAFHWVGGVSRGASYWERGWGVIINYGNEQSQLNVHFEFGLTGLR